MNEIKEQSEPPLVQLEKIPLKSLIPNTPLNNFFYSNGLSPYIAKMYLKVHRGLEDCRFLWELFSLNESLFHLWDFRFAWYQGFHYQPFFYTLYLKNEPLAVLPLWFNHQEKRFEWFGGTWPEDNYFFSKDEKFIHLLLKIAPTPIHLNAIEEDKINKKEFLSYLKSDEPKFILEIKQFKNIKDYLNKLEKKSRHSFRYYYKNFNNYSPKIKILEGDQSHLLPELKRLSIIDFERNDISEYRKTERMETFKMIYKNQGKYKIKTFLVYIQTLLVSYDILAVYKDNLYILTGASDLERFSGANTFITYLEIEYAFKQGCRYIDCMQIDYNWKHKYFFKKEMLKFEK